MSCKYLAISAVVIAVLSITEYSSIGQLLEQNQNLQGIFAKVNFFAILVGM